MNKEINKISQARLVKAKENIKVALSSIDQGFNNYSINRLCFATYHAMRAVNIMDSCDCKEHEEVSLHFIETYINKNIFNKKYLNLIKDSNILLNKTDFDDSYKPNKLEAKKHYEKTLEFINEIDRYLNKQNALI